MPDTKNDALKTIKAARTKFKKKMQIIRTSTREVLTDIETEQAKQRISKIRTDIKTNTL